MPVELIKVTSPPKAYKSRRLQLSKKTYKKSGQKGCVSHESLRDHEDRGDQRD